MTDDPLARVGSDRPSASGYPDIRRLVAVAAQRIEEVVNSAEAIAREIRENARAEADRYLEDRRREADRLAAERRRNLEEWTSKLRERFARVESETAALIAEAERGLTEIAAIPEPFAEPPASPSLAGEVGRVAETMSPVPPDEPPASRAPEPAPGAEDRARPNLGPAFAYAPSESWSNSGSEDTSTSIGGEAYASALIRATQLAVRGSERREIEVALCDEFGLEDAKPIVDQILGT
jgi:hypothetical protein